MSASASEIRTPLQSLLAACEMMHLTSLSRRQKGYVRARARSEGPFKPQRWVTQIDGENRLRSLSVTPQAGPSSHLELLGFSGLFWITKKGSQYFTYKKAYLYDVFSVTSNQLLAKVVDISHISPKANMVRWGMVLYLRAAFIVTLPHLLVNAK